MLPRIYPDRFQVAFGDHRLVADAGLILPVTLAQHLGLRELVDNHVDLGDAPGRANTGDKMLPLVASALAGGDCIDDADVLRTGRVDGASAAWSRRHPPWGRSCAASDGAMSVSWIGVSRELPARVWSAGAGPGDGPLTIDPDSTVGETYGLTKTFTPPRPLMRGAQRELGHRLWAPVGSPAGRHAAWWRGAPFEILAFVVLCAGIHVRLAVPQHGVN